jgi:VanZ family protein
MLLRHAPLAAVLVMISLGAVVSIPEPHLVAGQDKLNHALAFLAFAVTLRFAQPRVHWGWVMALTLLIGAGIEVVQAFISAMDATLLDVVADGVGGAIGCVVPSRSWAWIERRLSRRR